MANAVRGKPITSMLALGLASYLSLYPALIFPPLLLLCYDQSKIRGNAGSAASFFTIQSSLFSVSIAWFLYLSYMLTGGSWEFLSSTYGVQLLLPDLTPNVGLWWYFFIEMFDSFREFFLGVFWLHLGGYVGGLSIRIRTQPLFVITTLLGLFAIFKPYPSISDTSLYFALLSLYRHIFPRKNHKFPLSSSLTSNSYSDALPLLCRGCNNLCDSSRASFLLSLDLCRFGKCQLFLRHHPCLESWPLSNRGRFLIRCTQRRVGA